MKKIIVGIIVVVIIGAGVYVGTQRTGNPDTEQPTGINTPGKAEAPAPVEPPVEATTEAAAPEAPAETAATPAADTQPAEQKAETETQSADAAVAQSTENAEAATETAEAEAPPLDEETIVGTTWRVGMFKLTFKEDHVAYAKSGNQEMTGTWSIDGDTVTVGAGGNNVSATIVGNKLRAGKTYLLRLQ